jgi:diacylglycerol kinase (ATP)
VLKKNADIVAVAGGDGTVGRVARRLVGRRLPLTVLPMGTANNISRTLGIAGAKVTQLIPTWTSARRVKFDAGCATGPWGSRYFIEGVGIGLFPRVLPAIRKNETMANLIDAEAKVAYALQMLREHLDKCPAMKLKATLDGKDLSGKYILFEAMNTRYIGPSLFLAPGVSHDNGLLDVVFVQERDRKKLAKYLATWQEGKLWPMELGVGRGKRLHIEWTGYAMHIDDKLWPKKGKKKPRPPAPIKTTILRGAIEFLVPRKPLPGLGAKGHRQ